MALLQLLTAKVDEALRALGHAETPTPEVVQSSQPHFGHYQCNNALKWAPRLGLQPRALASQIAALLEKSCAGLLSKIEIAGPGFINMTIDPSFLAARVEQLAHDPLLGIAPPLKRERMIVEFSSPNIAKELHVGHLRSTIIGDSLARLFEFLGHDVLRLNHIGDWGTQFGMLIAYAEEVVPSALLTSSEAETSTSLTTWMHYYRAAKKKFDEDAAFKKRAQLKVIALQQGDEATRRSWRLICDASRRGFQEIYDLLGVELQERGESFYDPFLPALIADLEAKQLLTLSDGARCLFLEGFTGRDGAPLPMIVQKSDGGYNYATTDLAALRYRLEVDRADRIIVITDAGQTLHFQMLAAAAEKAGYFDPLKTRFDHVPFGVVLGPDGKKFKTRSGETERLIDLLLEATRRAKELLRERLGDSPELDATARILGIDALKYADLSCNRLKDYLFSYERMLRFDGNTAAFLLYAYVRIQGIKKRTEGRAVSSAGLHLEHPSEIALALHALRFPEALAQMAEELLPNRLTDYLYELAEKFHAFFRDCRVEGSPQEAGRLLLCDVTAQLLKRGLSLLGLETLDRM